ncbi:helix-turn-helix domain-containing protein [Chryseobacterium sp. NFX27]|uniref:helix-turn-helix domain-containing protein n=1 Tax=Chryseobacterium sp. NFX27 TaxID=2819618 RepID=UPI003CEC61AA
MNNTISIAKVSLEETEPQTQGYLAKEVLTFKEASALLGVSSSMLYKLTHKRAITFYKPNGKLIYFKRADLLNWMLSNKEEAIEETNTNFLNQLIERKHAGRN